MSIKTDFNKFIDDYPVWVIHVNTDRRFKCKECYSELTNDGEGLCTTCLGMGHKINLVRIPVRIMRQRPLRMPVGEWPYGDVSSFKTVIYSKQESYIQHKDLIIEVSWNVPTEYVSRVGQPTAVHHIYKVEEAEPFYENEVSYIAATCVVLDFTKDFIQDTLLRTGI